MVRECMALGITPLTEEEFAAEDRRMYNDLMRRRKGLYDGDFSTFTFGARR